MVFGVLPQVVQPVHRRAADPTEKLGALGLFPHPLLVSVCLQVISHFSAPAVPTGEEFADLARNWSWLRFLPASG